MESWIRQSWLRELFDTVFFIGSLYFIPVAAVIALFQIMCVVWSPFAGLICGIYARRLGLNVWKYGLAGFICSALLFVPWIFLMQGMRNKRIPYAGFVNLMYLGLYAVWLTLILGNIVVNITLMGMAKLLPIWLGGGASYEGATPIEYWQLLDNLIVPTAIGLLILIPSGFGFARRSRAKRTDMAHIEAVALIQPVYLAPFAGISATNVSILWMVFV